MSRNVTTIEITFGVPHLRSVIAVQLQVYLKHFGHFSAVFVDAGELTAYERSVYGGEIQRNRSFGCTAVWFRCGWRLFVGYEKQQCIRRA